MIASSPRPADPDTTGGELREESVDLTPGVVWTDAQLAVVRDLAARTHRAETERDTLAAQVQAVEGLAGTWERRAAAYGAADDRDKVTELRQRATAIRRALGTPTTGGGE